MNEHTQFDISLRKARPGDETGIGRVHVICWQETYSGFMPQDFLDNLKIEDRVTRWKKFLLDPEIRDQTWVAEKDEQVIGFVTGGKNREVNDDHCHELDCGR